MIILLIEQDHYFCYALYKRVNPGDGGLPESTDVAGWVGATTTPLTLLQINSHLQKLACRCPRGFPTMANLFRKIIVHTLSVGDRWTWPSQTCRMIFYYWKMCFLFEHPKDISELMVKTASFYLSPFLHNSSSKLAIYRQISVFSRENRRKSSKKRPTLATENDRTA